MITNANYNWIRRADLFVPSGGGEKFKSLRADRPI